MTGGGNSNSLKTKYKKEPYNKTQSLFHLFHIHLFRKLIHHSQYGSILIEFAFSIPIIILLLFFANDHFRIYELQNKLKTSAYLATSMFQQITNIRSDKQLTSNDIARIAYASCLNFFHTNTMFYPWQFGIFYSIDFFWVKRENENKYQYQNGWGSLERGNSPLSIAKSGSNTTTKTLSQIVQLHPDLVCDNDGDERVLFVSAYRMKNNFNKSKLSFFMLNPKMIRDKFGRTEILINYMLVIVPKPGLFPIRNE